MIGSPKRRTTKQIPPTKTTPTGHEAALQEQHLFSGDPDLDATLFAATNEIDLSDDVSLSEDENEAEGVNQIKDNGRRSQNCYNKEAIVMTIFFILFVVLMIAAFQSDEIITFLFRQLWYSGTPLHQPLH